MAATGPCFATAPKSPPPPPPETLEAAGPCPEQNSEASSDPQLASPGPEPPSPGAADAGALPTPPTAAPATPEPPPGPAAVCAAPRSPPSPGGSRLGPETFRQRFRQFRYQDAAGPREAFRQLRELSRQWLRPDIRTKEQIVEMLVQEQLLAILPEAARARRLRRRSDVRITG